MTGVKYYAVNDHGEAFPIMDIRMGRWVLQRSGDGTYRAVFRDRVGGCIAIDDAAVQAAIDAGEWCRVDEDQVDALLKRV